MSRLKTFLKYTLWIVGFSLLTYVLTFVGFNATYKNMPFPIDLPDCVTIKMAQSTTVNGRIYGEVTNNEEDLNNKYLRVNIFNKRNKLVGTKYLKLENLEKNVPKKFAVNFTAENIKRYTIDVVENSEELQKELFTAKNMYKDIFTDEELSGGLLLALVIALAFGL